MRLFWALELPDPIRARLADVQDELRAACPDVKVSWVPAENLHVTFKFLGDVEDETPGIDAVQTAIEKAGPDGPLELEVGELGSFGGKILWAGVRGAGVEPLAEAAGHVERALVRLGFPAERRRYRPHVTIGRIRQGRGRGRRGSSPIGRALQGIRLEPMPFAGSEIVLFQSSHGREAGPPAYTPIARVPLKRRSPQP